ncbi:MAG: RIP metalloprotease RseP [Bdellovibrionota bacterium]
MYYIVGILLLLGILIFIHEFGHFYVAKLCGMKVQTFSIGMGHKIFRFVRGETEYVLSWIPFGGYVKILGQDPREEVAPEEQHRSFSKMPIWKRFAVVIAGPAANFILAFFVFWALFAKGFPSPSATIHFVHPGSPAQVAGIQAGDKILHIKVGDKEAEVRELQDLQRFLRTHTATSAVLDIDRDGIRQQITVDAIQGKLTDPMTGLDRESLTMPGIEFQSYPPIYTAAKGSELEKLIPDPFFVIDSLEFGETKKPELSSSYEVQKAFAAALAEKQTLKLSVRAISLEADSKISEPRTVELSAENLSFSEFGFIPAHLLITQVLEGSAAYTLGLQKGDLIQELNGTPMWTFSQFRNQLQEFAAKDENLTLRWLRDGKTMQGVFIPQHIDRENPVTQLKEKKFQLGAMFVGFSEASFEKVKAKGFLDGISLAWDKTIAMSGSIVESFSLLITGKVSMKAMGGPVMIGKIAGDSLKLGMDYFLKMLAFISLNLAIMNLIPLPVLDGGHILLFMIEGITRRPMPMKFVEIWATSGFFLLISLALFVTFNDIVKLNVFAPIIGLFK